MSATRRCPAQATLEQFARGLLGEAGAEELRRHVEECPACRALVEPLRWAHRHARAETIAPTAAAELPAQVGRYRLEEPLARSETTQTVRVRDEEFDRPLTMKVLLSLSDALEEQFVHEARIIGRLQHPGVPAMHARGLLDDGRPYCVLRLIEGPSLQDLLAARFSSSAELPRLVEIFAQACQTIGFAHAQGVIHRDLRPSIVMVGAFGEMQIADWSLARAGETAGADRTGPVIGTPAYMAPERAQGEDALVDERADVYSLGGILCTILTGKPPYAPADPNQVYTLAVAADLADAHARLAGCGADAPLVDLARRCLAPRREDRPASGAAVADAVAKYQADLERRLWQAETDRAAAESKRRRLGFALAAVLLLLAAGAGIVGWWFRDAQRQHEGELALRRDYVNNAVAAALSEATARRQELQRRLQDPQEGPDLVSDIDRWSALLQAVKVAVARAEGLAAGSRELLSAPTAAQLEELKQLRAADERDLALVRQLDEIRLKATGRRGTGIRRGLRSRRPRGE